LLKALATKHRTALSWLKRDRGFLAALRAVGPRFRLGVVARSCNAQRRGTLRLTDLAPFRFVLELFVVKEQLFPSGEDEVRAAVHALQHLVLEFHGRAPFNPAPLRTEHNPTLEDDGKCVRTAEVSGSSYFYALPQARARNDAV
jgi:hypothetical protein